MDAAASRANPWRSPLTRLTFHGIRYAGGAVVALVLATQSASGSLHGKVDTAMDAARVGPPTPPAGDAEFLRRAALALTGMPPSAGEAREFLASTSPDKRAGLVTRLTEGPEFVRNLAVQLDVMLMERRAEMHSKAVDWRRWLEESLAANKPWDQLVREILAADGGAEKTRHVARWILERQAEPNLLTRDAGRLFLGCDMACAQCHDHPRIDDYFQRDYYGLLAFFGRTSLFQPDPNKPGMVAEQAAGDAAWTSVFTKVSGTTRPRLPGGREIDEPVIAEAEKWVVAPVEKDKNVRAVPKYSRRERLAGELVATPAFRRNIANRLWGMVMGRCLVEPPDLMHSGNAPAHPAVLDLLGDELAAMHYDLRSFIRELALTKTFAQAFDPEPLPASRRPELAARVEAMEAECAKLQEESGRLGVAFTECGEAFVKASLEAQPAIAEWNKLDAARVAAAKAAEDARNDLEQTEARQRSLAEAIPKLKAAAEAGAAAVTTVPDDKDLAAATRTFQDKIAKATADEAAAGKAIPDKKAAAEKKAGEADAARQSADAKKPAAAAAQDSVAAAMQAVEKADALKRSARIAAQQATRRLKELKAILDHSRAAEAAPPDGEQAAMKFVPSPVAPEEARAALAATGGQLFDVTNLAPLPPEQLCWSILKVTGTLDQLSASAAKEWDDKNKPSDADKADPAKQAARGAGIAGLLQEKLRPMENEFVRLFANGAGQPQNDFFATADQVLYFENAGAIRSWTHPGGNNLAERLMKLSDSKALADELYLSLLTRLPSPDESHDIAALMASRPPDNKASVISDAIWALLTSTEFRFRH